MDEKRQEELAMARTTIKKRKASAKGKVAIGLRKSQRILKSKRASGDRVIQILPQNLHKYGESLRRSRPDRKKPSGAM